MKFLQENWWLFCCWGLIMWFGPTYMAANRSIIIPQTVLPPELADCRYTEIEQPHGKKFAVIRCPNSITTTHHDNGKFPDVDITVEN